VFSATGPPQWRKYCYGFLHNSSRNPPPPRFSFLSLLVSKFPFLESFFSHGLFPHSWAGEPARHFQFAEFSRFSFLRYTNFFSHRFRKIFPFPLCFLMVSFKSRSPPREQFPRSQLFPFPPTSLSNKCDPFASAHSGGRSFDVSSLTLPATGSSSTNRLSFPIQSAFPPPFLLCLQLA